MGQIKPNDKLAQARETLRDSGYTHWFDVRETGTNKMEEKWVSGTGRYYVNITVEYGTSNIITKCKVSRPRSI